MHQGSLGFVERSRAPQAAAHRRGGTHKVRDEDKTNSIYDTYNYRELLDVARERGIYRKDMKKVEMAWALKQNDEEKRRAERDHLNSTRKKQQEAKREQERIAAEKKALLKAKQDRRMEKVMKRKRDESVSEDTSSETDAEADMETRNEYEHEAIGQALSDSSWDSTSTESITDFTDEVLKPSCKLRILEWPYETMPPVNPRPTLLYLLDLEPRQMPYAPLKITTTLSKQKLCLPGLKYPPSVDPDFVPLLPASVRVAAHRGRLEGILRTALIETGEEWASRTHVQAGNATLYFHPSNVSNPAKSLAGVYEKWNVEKRRLRRINATCEARPGAREERRRQRKRNKCRMVAEVYDACRWRPGAVGFIPAYLDFGDRAGEKNENEKTLGNLRFVRFSGCDVPHYYFWIKNERRSNGHGGEMEGERQHATIGARKRPCKIQALPINDGTCGSETPIGDEVEGVLEKIGSDTSAEGRFRKASVTSMFSQETDRNHSIAQWLDQIGMSRDAPPTPLSLSGAWDIAELDD